MSKRLIINADDFGLTEDVNRGVIECYANGSVTDISLLAAGDAFEDAVKRAKESRIRKIGVHLALTESFRPVTPAENIPSLVDETNRFFRSCLSFFAKYFAGLTEEQEIYTELKSQIQKVKREGFRISHLNSHQHVHMVPGILKIAIELMKEENIDYVRFPREGIDIIANLKDFLSVIRNLMLLSMCRLSHGLINDPRVKHNDYFIGHARALRLGREDMIGAISALKDGLTELGCHPGYFTDDVKRRYPHYRNCEEELEILCDESFAGEIKARAVELISY